MTWMDAILIYGLLVIGIIAIPGMGMLLVLAHALEHGRRAGFTVVAGIMSVGAVHMVWGALDTALFLTLPGPVFKVMLLAGAGYPGWLGWTLLRSSVIVDAVASVNPVSPWTGYCRGVHRRICGFRMYNQGGFAVTTTSQ